MDLSVILPTLNEEQDLPDLLSSIENQTRSVFEVVVVDGGSTDGTVDIALDRGARVLICPSAGEYEARNIGSRVARGTILVNTAADIIWPAYLVERIERHLTQSPRLVGLTGPGIPIDPPAWARIEYSTWNLARYMLSHWGKFLTSTNFLVCPKAAFLEAGGLNVDDINADGKFGRYLRSIGPVKFALDTHVFISSRRMRQAGLLGFNRTFLYVAENFIPTLGRSRAFQRLIKEASSIRHSRRSGSDGNEEDPA